MLDGLDPLGQRLGRIAVQHRGPGLAQNGARVDIIDHQMDRAAGLGVSRLDGAGMGIQPRIERQQAGMDI